MIQRKLVGEEAINLGAGGIDPGVARPSPDRRDFKGKVSILCFYRRNLQQPFTVIEGCFFSGSRRVVLSWPVSLGQNPTPTILVGSWLCEASIARSTFGDSGATPATTGACNRHSGTYPRLDDDTGRDGKDDATDITNLKRHYRRGFSFHRVTQVGEPILGTDTSGNLQRFYLEVQIERPAFGFPLKWADPLTVDSWTVPVNASSIPTGYTLPRWPIFDPRDPAPGFSARAPNFDDESSQSQDLLKSSGSAVATEAQPFPFFPVILFDGLREVFEYEL
jgi:hypothetical protein